MLLEFETNDSSPELMMVFIVVVACPVLAGRSSLYTLNQVRCISYSCQILHVVLVARDCCLLTCYLLIWYLVKD